MRQYRGRRKDNGEWVYGYLIGKDVIVGDIVEFCADRKPWLVAMPLEVFQRLIGRDKV